MSVDARDLALYERLLLVRMAEEKVVELYFDDHMKTPVHLSIGQEAVAVGVCDALRPEDQIFGTYRSHAFYLARTGETKNFFLELHGRGTAWQKGKAGSMHLAAPSHGYMASSAVVATTIPMALGAAFAKKYKGEDGVVVAFLGDGAIDEGVFWETLNYSSVAQLPLLLVCEDNDYAIHASAESRHGYERIGAIAECFRCHVAESDSTDPVVLSQHVTKAKEQYQETQRPAFLHFKCYRYKQHVGVGDDFEAGYRSREGFEAWRRRDALTLLSERLIARGKVSQGALDAVRERIAAELSLSVSEALAAPLPPPEELTRDVFV